MFFFARTVSKKLSEKLLHTRLVFGDPGPPREKTWMNLVKPLEFGLVQVPVTLSNPHGITNITNIYVLFCSGQLGQFVYVKSHWAPLWKGLHCSPDKTVTYNCNSCWEMNWSTKPHYLSSSFCSQGLACKTSCLPHVSCFIIHHYIVMFNWWMSELISNSSIATLCSAGLKASEWSWHGPCGHARFGKSVLELFVCLFLVKTMVIVVFIFSTAWNQFWRSMSRTSSTD